ncbi:MAG: LacI family transcriptional regulator [Pseudonocardiales bacterium]|nr:MAG: LacI family transcriptional regulator [Pseudonocardiales bacterium]
MTSPRSRPTVFDVARSAQVSIATVSRVLNGRAVADQALVARVRSAARELGYRPNTVARDFRHGVTRTIGVIVPDLANPFFPDVVKGLADDVTEGDHRLLIADCGEDPDEELRLVGELSGRCDGIVLCSPRMSAENLAAVAGWGIPLVCTNRELDGLPFGTVGVDSAIGMAQAVEHLAALGHRDIGYLAGPTTSWSDRGRRAGLHSAAEQCGVSVSVTLAGSTSDAGYQALPDLLRRNVTAVLAFNDLVALGALARLRELGLDVPTALSVVGFDDLPVAAFLGPPLTTVIVPKHELGRRAGAMLRQLLVDGAIARQERLPSSLVVRESTGPPRPRPAG